MFPSTLRFTAEDEELRSAARTWLAANDPGAAPRDYAQRLEALTEWQASLHAAGFIGLSWPKEYGGSGLGVRAEAVFAEELARSSMPQLINRLGMYTWGPTILDHGTEDQRRRFLPGMLDASEVWCQGFSEPDAGSDLAAVRTTGTVDGDDLVVNGQKVWTSRAEISKWNALLVRTNPDVKPHAGLSVVILDMTAPGVTIRPMLQMLHEPHFSEVFFDEVRVPVANVLGGIDEGWRIAMAAMGYERGLFVLERQIGLRKRLDQLTTAVVRAGIAGEAQERIGNLHAKLEVLNSQVYRTLSGQSAGTLAPGETSVDKLFLADVYQDLFAAAFDLLAEGAAIDDDADWSHDLLESRSVSIYSGTSEIQKNIITRQLLGLR